MENLSGKLKRHFTGWFIPRQIVDLFDEKTLSASEVILLSTIDSLVDPERGCYASNSYLAEQVGFDDPRSIPKKLKKFKSLGLIEVHLSEDRQTRAIYTLWNPIKCSKDVWPNDHPRVAKRPRGLSLIGKDNKTKYTRRNNSDEEVASDKVVGFGLLPVKDNTNPVDMDLAKKLKEIILNNSTRSPRINLTNWAKEFQILRCKEEVNEDLILQALEWLSLHFKDPYSPVILSAKSFRQKFEKLLIGMEKDSRHKPPVKITYSDEIQRQADLLLNSLRNLNWPAPALAQLPDLVSEACQIATDLRKITLRIQHQEFGSITNREILAIHAVRNRLQTNSLLDYFQGVYSKIANWKSWGGSMESFRFTNTEKHSNLRSWILPSCEKYSCVKLLNQILKLKDAQ